MSASNAEKVASVMNALSEKGTASFTTLMNGLKAGREGSARFATLVNELSIENGVPNLSTWLNNANPDQVDKFATLLNSAGDLEVTLLAGMINAFGAKVPRGEVARAPDALMGMMSGVIGLGAEGIKRAAGTQGTTGCSILACVLFIAGVGIAAITP